MLCGVGVNGLLGNIGADQSGPERKRPTSINYGESSSYPNLPMEAMPMEQARKISALMMLRELTHRAQMAQPISQQRQPSELPGSKSSYLSLKDLPLYSELDQSRYLAQRKSNHGLTESDSLPMQVGEQQVNVERHAKKDINLLTDYFAYDQSNLDKKSLLKMIQNAAATRNQGT